MNSRIDEEEFKIEFQGPLNMFEKKLRKDIEKLDEINYNMKKINSKLTYVPKRTIPITYAFQCVR